MILKSTNHLVKVPSPECIQSFLLNMEKLEIHPISLDNKKNLSILRDLMISSRINSCSYNVTILWKMTQYYWQVSKCTKWKKTWITPWTLRKIWKQTQICLKLEQKLEYMRAKSLGLETKEPIIWKEKVFNTFAINMTQKLLSSNLLLSILSNLTILS